MRPRITVVGILRAGVQPFLEVCGRRRQDKHADDVGAGLLPQLLGALPVDIEQHVLPGRQAPLRPARAACRSDCRTRWPIRAVRSASPSLRISACRRTDSRGLRLRRAASAAWSPTPTFAGRASVRSACATAWSCRRPTATTARTSIRAAQPRRSRWPPAVMITPDSEPVRGIARPRSSSRGRYWSIRDRSTWSSRY